MPAARHIANRSTTREAQNRRIISLLEADSQVSDRRIATLIGCSATTVRHRRQELEELARIAPRENPVTDGQPGYPGLKHGGQDRPVAGRRGP